MKNNPSNMIKLPDTGSAWLICQPKPAQEIATPAPQIAGSQAHIMASTGPHLLKKMAVQNTRPENPPIITDFCYVCHVQNGTSGAV